MPENPGTASMEYAYSEKQYKLHVYIFVHVQEGQKGLLTVRHKASYAKQLMLALAYLHKEKSIIHR